MKSTAGERPGLSVFTGRRGVNVLHVAAPGYREIAVFWVVSAKREEPRERRRQTLNADSAARQRTGPLRKTSATQ